MTTIALQLWVVAQEGLGDLGENPPLIRDYFSFDWDDMIAMVVALTALIALFVTRRTSAKTDTTSDTHTVSEEVNEGVLAKFTELFERITKLEAELASTKVKLQEALDEIREMHKLEEFLQARLHEKDQEIKAMQDGHTADLAKKEAELLKLQDSLDLASLRISKLEKLCREQGMDVDKFNETNGFG